MSKLLAPFVWFGGKAPIAGTVWTRFGKVSTYIEPFAGSLAVLLKAPRPAPIEVVNDLECCVVNFWRALKHAPTQLAEFYDDPITEIDTIARNNWVVGRLDSLRAKLLEDPEAYDLQLAGYWWYAVSNTVGGLWRGIRFEKRKVAITDKGMRSKKDLQALADRLRGVQVNSGDWERVVTDAMLYTRPITGVFLDPPYAETMRSLRCYTHDSGELYECVRAWAIARGDDPRLRIALCGYDFGQEMPNWTKTAWTGPTGLSRGENSQLAENRQKEAIWFSPHCLSPQKTAMDLFEVHED